MLAAINGFLDWMSLPQYKVKPLKIQREIFARPEKELTQTEYHRLADLLGHSSINITKIYSMESGRNTPDSLTTWG